jgi:hypothetical protein
VLVGRVERTFWSHSRRNACFLGGFPGSDGRLHRILGGKGHFLDCSFAVSLIRNGYYPILFINTLCHLLSDDEYSLLR